MEAGTASLKYAFVTHTPPGQQQAPCILGIERFAVFSVSGGNYGFSGEAVDARRTCASGTWKPRIALLRETVGRKVLPMVVRE